jgi:hypothetical protein
MCNVQAAPDSREKLLEQAVPARMTDEQLEKIATWLARWKNGDIVEPESDEVEKFVFHWAGLVCRLQASTLMERFGRAHTELLVIAMAELEYLSQQELVSRRLRYRTYQADLEDIFDVERMKRAAPDFLRRYLKLCGFGILCEDLSVATSLIAKFLDSSHIHEYSPRKSTSVEPPVAQAPIAQKIPCTNCNGMEL